MKNIFPFVTLLVAVVHCPASANGAEVQFRVSLPTPQRENYADALPEEERGRANVDALAQCLLRNDKEQVLAVIARGPTLEGESAQKRLVASVCRPSAGTKYAWLALYGSLLRAKLIDMYSGRTFVAGQEIPIVNDVQPPITIVVENDGSRAPTRLADSIQDREAPVSLKEYAGCLIRADFKAASEFVIEPSGSTEENRAYDRLVPRMAGCSPNGQAVKMVKSVLVQILAEALQAKIATAREVRPNA